MNVIKKFEYNDYRIHIMQFNNVFQYLITDSNRNLYQDHITVPASFINIIKFKLGLIDNKYTEEEMNVAEEIVLNGAIQSIDALVSGLNQEEKTLKEISKMANNKKILKMNLPEKYRNKCMWRAVTAEDGELAFQCLNHPENIVRVPEGEKPTHEIKKPVLNSDDGEKSLSQNTPTE